ncbi:TonB-dependent siderophore receptor [Leptolyngbya sp. FACHB-1515]|uniref:TonB-dependent siderophore receptor n=1 Tax=Leptolyngbya sp. FACHB-1515 TaxID=2933931 RepID=UPI00329879AD
MNYRQLGYKVLISLAGAIAAVLPAQAQNRPATTVEAWLAQESIYLAQSAASVIGVQANATETGLEVLLETEGAIATPTTSVIGNALIADIPNAVLALPEGDEFLLENPAEGIALITVSPRRDGIRVAITGLDAPPIAEVETAEQGLLLSVAIGTETTGEIEDSIEVVVTGEQDEDYFVPDVEVGTRTDTPLRDIPFSIQVIPEQVLEDQQPRSITEVIRNVPGITIVNPPQFVSEDFFFSRGFETDVTLNGLRDTTLGTTGSALVNLERIEVLRGPAGALFGSGAPGGTINLVTRQPQSESAYEIEGSIGSFNTYEGSIDFTGSLNADDTLLYRFSASASQLGNEGFAPESERYFIAPVLTWQMSDDTQITFEGQYFAGWSPNGFGLPAIGTIFENPNGDIPRDRYIGEPSFDQNDRQVGRVGYNFEHRFSENWQLQNSFRASFQQFEENVVSGIELLEDNRTLIRSAGFSDAYRNVYLLDTNVVGNFETGSIAHQLLFGFDLSTDFFEVTFGEAEIAPLDLFDPVYGSETVGESRRDENPFAQTIDRLGIFLQDQITLLPNLRVLLGGRFDIISQEAEFAGDVDFQQDEAFSPRFGIVYQPSETVSLYGSYSRSFEQTAGTTFDRELFEPIRGTQYEIGVKVDWLEDLSTTLALYEITRTNVLTDDPENPGFSIQTGEQRSRGVELNVTGEILPGWNVIGGYAYTDAEITEDNVFEVGNSLAGIPEHAVSLWTTYEIRSGSLEGLGFGLGLFYVGERQGTLENSFTLPDYLRTDAALYYRRNDFRAALNVRNLFDVEYFETPLNSDDLSLLAGFPFTVQFTLGWQF